MSFLRPLLTPCRGVGLELPVEEVGHGFRKSALFFSIVYLRHISKKTLNTLHCIILHAALKRSAGLWNPTSLRGYR